MDETESTSSKAEILLRKIEGGSCLGCAYLYFQDQGYSNWTVEETQVACIKDANPNLPAREPWDWKKQYEKDDWPATKHSICGQAYLVTDNFDRVHLDVDGETKLADFDLPDPVRAVFKEAGID